MDKDKVTVIMAVVITVVIITCAVMIQAFDKKEERWEDRLVDDINDKKVYAVYTNTTAFYDIWQDPYATIVDDDKLYVRSNHDGKESYFVVSFKVITSVGYY